MGRDSYEDMLGIEYRLALPHSFGVHPGRTSLNHCFRTCSANAEAILGLESHKGSSTPNAASDIVIFDPKKQAALCQLLLRGQMDCAQYESFELQGCPVVALLLMRIIAQSVNFTGESADGIDP